MSLSSVLKKISAVVQNEIFMDQSFNGMPLMDSPSVYILMTAQVLRQKREEKYKGLQHD